MRPHAIAAVEDQRGETVLRKRGERGPVLSPAAAWQTLALLREGPDGPSGENIGLWPGHPVELPRS